MAAEAGTGDSVERLLADAIGLARDCGRTDLVRELGIARDRAARPSVTLCVAGEFKQGKSALVNALVGRESCPVDDDLATAAITLVCHADTPTARVRRLENGTPKVEEIPVDQVAAFASERGNPGNRLGIDLVEIGLPSGVLKRGIAVVDTPGVVALRQGPATALTDFLRFADALILTTDASAELAAPELRFLNQARSHCPTVLVALTKTDLYPEWRRIAELDARHLEPLGLADAIVPVSSVLRLEALRRGDADLNDRSGFPTFLQALQSRIIDRATDLTTARAAADVIRACRILESAIGAGLEALEDPEAAEHQLAEFRAAQDRLARLREAGSRWSITLNDAMADLRSSLEYRLRSGIRSLMQDVDADLTDKHVAKKWDEVTEQVRDRLGAEAAALLDEERDGAVAIARQVAEVIETDLPEVIDEVGYLDISVMWSETDRSLSEKRRGVLGGGLTALRGGYSGMLMLGMLGQLAGVALMLPLTLGAGALLGTKQVLDDRKRQADRQRQEARNLIRQFLTQAQDEVGTRMRQAIQDHHRALRDHFSEDLKRLSETNMAKAQALQESLQAVESDRRRRIDLLRKAAVRTNALAKRAGTLIESSRGSDGAH
jgi:hypothetical protein